MMSRFLPFTMELPISLRWLIGCFVGAVFASLGLLTEFFGQLILFGGLLGIGQALLIFGYFEARMTWLVSWFMVSFFGWIFGSVLTVFAGTLFSAYSPADWGIGEVAYVGAPWVLMSLGQALVLAAHSSGRIRTSLIYASCWFVAGSVGGVLVETVLFSSSDLADQIAASLGEVGALLALYTGLIVTVYGVPTGIVLTLWLRRR